MLHPLDAVTMIHTYKTEFPIYALSWSQRADKPFRLALGSYVELQANKVGRAFLPSSSF